MLVLKRKQVVVVALAMLIGVAGYLNWEYQKGVSDGTVADVMVPMDDTERPTDEELGNVHLVANDNSTDVIENTEVAKNDFFATARLDRETSRSKAVETLNSIISNKDTEKGSKEEAEKQIMDMSKETQNESSVESMIKAKGFADAVCYISEGKASVMVKSTGLTKQDIAKIQEIVTAQTGLNAENIKIVEVK